MAQTLKRKAATVESQNTNLIARANRSSLDNPGTVVPRENSRFKATAMPGRLEMVDSNPSISAAKVQQNSETTKDKGQKRALERESRVRQSLMEGKLLWKRAEIASDYSDLNQGLYKQPGMLSEPAVQVRVHPQSDLSTAKVQRK